MATKNNLPQKIRKNHIRRLRPSPDMWYNHPSVFPLGGGTPPL